MARFFFDLQECGTVIEDDEGSEFVGADDAHAYAIKAASSIMMAEVADGRLCLDCCIIARSECRNPVCQVWFREAIQLSGC